MDIVYIKELEVETIIGIFDWERERKQTVSIDLELGCDIRAAARTDSIAAALDYKAVSHRVAGFVAASRFLLVEALAEAIAELVLAEFRIPWLRLRVGKPGAVTGSKDTGVVIERRNRNGATESASLAGGRAAAGNDPAGAAPTRDMSVVDSREPAGTNSSDGKA